MTQEQKIKEFVDTWGHLLPSEGTMDDEGIRETFIDDLTNLLDSHIDIKTLLTKIAHFDMSKHFGFTEDFFGMDDEDFDYIFLSLPSLIMREVAEEYLEWSEIVDILKTVKIKHKKVEEFVKENPQIAIEYKKKEKLG